MSCGQDAKSMGISPGHAHLPPTISHDRTEREESHIEPTIDGGRAPYNKVTDHFSLIISIATFVFDSGLFMMVVWILEGVPPGS